MTRLVQLHIPERLHLVSTVVSGRFVDPRGQLEVLDLPTMKRYRRGPKGFAYVEPDLLRPTDAIAWEATWKATEDRLAEAIDAVEAGTVFSTPDLVAALKDCIAIHLARSHVVISVDGLGAAEAIPGLIARLVGTDGLRADFARAHGGLVPGGPSAEAQHAASLIARSIPRVAADRMAHLYGRAQREVLSKGTLQVAVATEGDFLIGDSPAQSIKEGHPGVGPMQGVPWDAGSTVLMPVGPHHTIALGPVAEYVSFDRSAVGRLNSIQVLGAARRVAWRPSPDDPPLAPPSSAAMANGGGEPDDVGSAPDAPGA